MRIRWTLEEQQVLIEQTAQILFAKNALSLREAFNKAQKTMPAHRQREIAALSQVPWLTDSIPTRLQELRVTAQNDTEQRIATATAEARAAGVAEAENKFIATAGDLLAKVLLSALQHPELAEVFYRKSETQLTNVGQAVSRAVRQKKQKVIVAGILNSQARKLEESYKDKLDLKFWTKDQSNEALRQMLVQADAAVGMVGFLAHSHDGILKASKVPYYPVSGGVTSLKQKLEQLV